MTGNAFASLLRNGSDLDELGFVVGQWPEVALFVTLARPEETGGDQLATDPRTETESFVTEIAFQLAHLRIVAEIFRRVQFDKFEIAGFGRRARVGVDRVDAI